MTNKNSESTKAPEKKGGGSKNLAMQIMGVTKQFGSNVAVDNVTFDVRRGEVLGFLGPNGSGKSTTMRLITSFYTPDSGRILVEGLDNQQHDKETRAMIGYLPENNPLYGDLLVNEYLNYVADLRGLTRAERRENIAVAVDETGIQEVFYKPVSTCSKGYRQRAGLAGAILHQPDILIMDEPTEGLDPNQRVPIRELYTQDGQRADGHAQHARPARGRGGLRPAHHHQARQNRRAGHPRRAAKPSSEPEPRRPRSRG